MLLQICNTLFCLYNIILNILKNCSSVLFFYTKSKTYKITLDFTEFNFINTMKKETFFKIFTPMFHLRQKVIQLLKNIRMKLIFGLIVLLMHLITALA